jgi:hypothetical protein
LNLLFALEDPGDLDGTGRAAGLAGLAPGAFIFVEHPYIAVMHPHDDLFV